MVGIIGKFNDAYACRFSSLFLSTNLVTMVNEYHLAIILDEERRKSTSERLLGWT